MPKNRPRQQPDDVLPLVALVRRCIAETGWSINGFAERRGIAYSTLRRYSDTRLRPLSSPPRGATLRDLSLALHVPLPQVEAAADASVARNYPRVHRDVDGDTTISIGSLHEMPPAERRRKAQEYRAILDEILNETGDR